MRQRAMFGLLGVCLSSCLVPAGDARAADRSAAEILKELDDTRPPGFDKAKAKGHSAYTNQYMAERDRAMEKRAALILEFCEAAPDHEKISGLMTERWINLIARRNRSGLAAEIERILAETADPKLKVEAAFARAELECAESFTRGDADVRLIDRALRLAPRDPRGPNLLRYASRGIRDEAAVNRLRARVLREFPDSDAAAIIRGLGRRETGIGKPFNLEFKDAIKGSRVSNKQLRGKVVVIDFWASWCGPCVDELPALKELYAKYRGYGVEFIGVSLDYPTDQGGLEALKKCVVEHRIPWPEYSPGERVRGRVFPRVGHPGDTDHLRDRPRGERLFDGGPRQARHDHPGVDRSGGGRAIRHPARLPAEAADAPSQAE